MIKTRIAQIDDLKEVTHLFDLYRIFYGQASDEGQCHKFLSERFVKGESVVLISFIESQIVGFTQLYPCFSSVSLKKQWILNDLFVKEEFRGTGIARKLLSEAKKIAKKSDDCKGLTLKTAVSNIKAQKLYEGMEWKLEDSFISYNLDID